MSHADSPRIVSNSNPWLKSTRMMVLVCGLVMALDAAASAQMFGQRTVGRPLTRRQGPGAGNSRTMASQEQTGQLQLNGLFAAIDERPILSVQIVEIPRGLSEANKLAASWFGLRPPGYALTKTPAPASTLHCNPLRPVKCICLNCKWPLTLTLDKRFNYRQIESPN